MKKRTQVTCWNCESMYYKDGSNDSPRDHLCMRCYYPICTLLESKVGYAHVDWNEEKWKKEAQKLIQKSGDKK